MSKFEIQAYNDTFTGPSGGSNGYYMTTVRNSPNCQRMSEILSVTKNSRLILTAYLSTIDSQNVTLFIFGLDPSNPTTPLVTRPITLIGDKVWRENEMKFSYDGDIVLQINCEVLDPKGGFLAIHSIKIETPDIEECMDSTTSTTEDTSEISTTEAYIDSTTEDPIGLYCIEEDFNDGTLGQFNTECLFVGGTMSKFEIQAYNDTFTGPSGGSNGYYMTPVRNSPNCQRMSEILSVTKNSRLILTAYLSTINSLNVTLFIFGLDPSNPTNPLVARPVTLIGDKVWRENEMKFSYDGDIVLQINCEVLDPKGGFLAIHSIKIETPDIEECMDSTTSTTEDTSEISTTEAYIDSTTEAPIGLYCIEEDFNDGTLGQFNTECLFVGGTMSKFEIQAYNDTFTGPSGGSNGYYMTPVRNSPNCQRMSEILSVTKNSRLILTAYLSTINSLNVTLFIFGLDPSNPTNPLVARPVTLIGDKVWRENEMKFSYDGDIVLQINCEVLDPKEGFLAIHSIKIETPDIEECMVSTTSTTEDTSEISTTEASIDSTTEDPIGLYCIEEDFNDGTLGQFNTECLFVGGTMSKFEIQAYNDTFTGPSGGSKGYYMTTVRNSLNCQRMSEILSVTKNSRLILTAYLSTINSQSVNLFIFGLDPSNPTTPLVTRPVTLIGDKVWRENEMKFSYDGDIVLQINCEALDPKEGFLAIHSIKIETPDIEECMDTLTSEINPKPEPLMHL
ncbi:uncharacterized protein LOC143910225 [Arctopsyche grandis]|uniref:uncharacterized protein LOC143910225 n=1 Tax=Arctopsyche grandis TaxID=121162 RepID=UPI00406D6597